MEYAPNYKRRKMAMALSVIKTAISKVLPASIVRLVSAEDTS